MDGSLSNYSIPDNYKVLKVLGKGSNGIVFKSRNKDNNELVAIKLGNTEGLLKELKIMELLKKGNMNSHNIITLKGQFNYKETLGLMYELLDMDLSTYIKRRKIPMQLKDVRLIIQQLAVALKALHGIGIIHTDVKPDNIMIVQSMDTALKVKLIDFGLAILKSEPKEGLIQPPGYRAPEVILRLPYTAAVDMWSLGVVMAQMLFHCPLFPSVYEHVLISQMNELLGPPPAHLLRKHSKSSKFFTNVSGEWILKSSGKESEDRREYKFRSFNEKFIRNGGSNVVERTECINLLKAMLQWDAKKRITPTGILNHPFITKIYIKKNSSSHNKLENETGKEDTTRVVVPEFNHLSIFKHACLCLSCLRIRKEFLSKKIKSIFT